MSDGWIPWKPGDAVEVWAEDPDHCLVSVDAGDGETQYICEAKFLAIAAVWIGADVCYQCEPEEVCGTVTAYRRKPEPYKPVEGIAVGQVRKTSMGAEATVIGEQAGYWRVSVLYSADNSVGDTVTAEELLSWPVVRVLDKEVGS